MLSWKRAQCGPRIASASASSTRVAHHVGGERAGDARHPRDLLGLGAVERLHHRVEHLAAGIGAADGGLDLRVHRRDDIRREQALDDHRPVVVERGEQIVAAPRQRRTAGSSRSAGQRH